MDLKNSNHSAEAGSSATANPVETSESSTTANPPAATNSSAGTATGLRPDDCAVNAWGWGIPIPDCVDRNNITILNAGSPAQIYENFTQVYTEHTQHGSPGRSPFSFTAQELAENGKHRYILVGFALPSLDIQYRRMAPSNRAVRGYTHMDNDAVTVVPGSGSDGLVMVVAPVKDHVPQVAKLYALLDSPSGLCLPQLTGFEQCFYLPMFRAKISISNHSRHGGKPLHRRAAWNDRVRNASVIRESSRQSPGQAARDPPAADDAMDEWDNDSVS